MTVIEYQSYQYSEEVCIDFRRLMNRHFLWCVSTISKGEVESSIPS